MEIIITFILAISNIYALIIIEQIEKVVAPNTHPKVQYRPIYKVRRSKKYKRYKDKGDPHSFKFSPKGLYNFLINFFYI